MNLAEAKTIFDRIGTRIGNEIHATLSQHQAIRALLEHEWSLLVKESDKAAEEKKDA